ncbi:MAG: TorF family putative porin [Planctomycetota bacterium]
MNSPKLTRLFTTAAVVGALSVPALADGHEEEGIFIPGASAEVTLDYVTQYFFRGYEQSNTDTGGSLQPGASLTLDVVEDVTATIGVWSAFEFDAPAANANPSAFYENDVYASLDTTMGDFSMGAGLTYFTYPGPGGNDVLEAFAYLGYDDSDLLGDFAFAPYILIATELNNSNVNFGAPQPGKEATYLEVGGEFGIPTEGTAIEAWSWSVPFAFGLSLDDYYNDASGAEEFFGYASVGLSGSIAMSELIGTDEWVGAWDLSVGITVLFLNSDVAMTDNTADESDNVQLIGTVGISRSW